MKSGVHMSQPVLGAEGQMHNTNVNNLTPVLSSGRLKEKDGKLKSTRDVIEAKKMKLAETHEIPEEWENNVEKVSFFYKI